MLLDHGVASLIELSEAPVELLASIPGISQEGAETVRQRAAELHEQKLAVLEEALKNIRKYVIVIDQNDTQVTIIDLEDKASSDLYNMGVIQESNQQ